VFDTACRWCSDENLSVHKAHGHPHIAGADLRAPCTVNTGGGFLPGAGIPEFMGGQPASGHSVPTTVVAPAQATWVDDIANALDSYFKAHYPTSDFTSALKKLTLVRDAEDRGDRRTVQVGHPRK